MGKRWLRKALGVSNSQRRLSRKLGIPLSKYGGLVGLAGGITLLTCLVLCSAPLSLIVPAPTGQVGTHHDEPAAAATESPTAKEAPAPDPDSDRSAALPGKDVRVKGYVKKDGTVVKPYERAAPGMGRGGHH